MLSIEQTKQLESFLESLAKTAPVSDAGTISLIGGDISDDDPLYGCAVVHFDFDLDECPWEQRDLFYDWCHNVAPRALRLYMATLGFTIADHNDASGGVHYNCSTYYRKVG